MLDFLKFFDSLFTESYPVLILFITLLIFEVLFLLATIKLLRNQYTKLLFRFVSFYWTAQIVYFGINGYTYAFTTGPEIAFYFRYVGFIETGYFLKTFTSEISFHINGDSDRVYFGINLIPILISTALIYLSKENSLPGNIENEEKMTGINEE